MKSVDLVIPCYNEERVLAASVEKLRAWCAEHLPAYKWRILVADNASTDGTLAVAQRLAAEHPDDVAALHLDRKGRGRALKRAWLESPADAMCYMDVDLSTDLADITPLLSGVLEEGYDLAYGSRVAGASDIERSLKREINSRGYITLIKLLFWTKFSDAQCGFKAITREAAQRLLPQVRDGEWFFDTELLILAEKAGYKLKEVPVRWVEDPDSRVKFPQDILKMARDLLRLRFRRPEASAPRRAPQPRATSGISRRHQFAVGGRTHPVTLDELSRNELNLVMLAAEDSLGLYEVLAKQRVTPNRVSEGKRNLESAKRLVGDLVGHGWLEGFRKSTDGSGTEEAMPELEALKAIQEDDNWLPPDQHQPMIGIRLADTAREAFTQDGGQTST